MLHDTVALFAYRKQVSPLRADNVRTRFRNIAEGIMAKDIKLDVRDAKDTSSVLCPDVKAGNVARRRLCAVAFGH